MVRAMRRWLSKMFLVATMLGAGALPVHADGAALIGSRVLNFSLPGSTDRLVNYGTDYYGRYNLIITLYPAAFTPV